MSNEIEKLNNNREELEKIKDNVIELTNKI